MPAPPETKLPTTDIAIREVPHQLWRGADCASCPRVSERRSALRHTRRAGEVLHHEEHREEGRDEPQSRGSSAQNHREPAQIVASFGQWRPMLQKFASEWAAFWP